MSHQLLPTHKLLQKHYCLPTVYLHLLAEGKYEADIVLTIKALVEKKNQIQCPATVIT